VSVSITHTVNDSPATPQTLFQPEAGLSVAEMLKGFSCNATVTPVLNELVVSGFSHCDLTQGSGKL
jgi:hypothetical protein